ncbi:MAG: hypothetical protein DI539_15835 [Flavobacterium psychrophilum]|nr:MAG: hypothetical protein DI539_15835 [Flavobacterium psychrophilum]
MTDFLIKSTVAMGVLLGLYYILFEREKMHRFNRFYLLSSLVFSLALPFVTIPIYVEAEAPVQPLPMEQALEFREQQIPDNTFDAKTATEPPAPVVVKTVTEPRINYWPYLGWGLYITIVLILTIRFLLNILHFYNTKRNNLTVSYKGTSLVLLNYNVMPHTFLGNIYVSKEEYDNKLIATELFTHELVHVKQFHTLDILFIEALKTLFWFNPLLYFYKKAIQLNHEFLADEKVIDDTANTIYYQKLLLERANVGKAFSLASNLNFSLTKKRFIMMTKTTNHTRSMILKLTSLPILAGLIYFLSTETVVLAKPADNRIPELAPVPETVIPASDTATILQTDSVKQQPEAIKPSTPDPEARKNEYYKGVRVIIEDAQRGKYIDLPYEKLTAEDKKYYLPEAPDKKGKAKGIQEADYNYSLYKLYEEKQNIQYFVDDKKVTRDEVLKYKKEDFATFAAKSSGMKIVNGKPEGNHKSFFYTYPYYEKNLKNIYDHYPDKNLKINLTAKAEPYKSDFADEAKATGKTELQLMAEKEKRDEEADTYNTVEDRKSQQRYFYPRFSGSKEEFDQYLSENLQLPERYKGTKLSIHFTVNTNGKLSDVWIPGEKDEQFLNEVTRVIENSPAWIPSQKNGQALRVGFSADYPVK